MRTAGVHDSPRNTQIGPAPIDLGGRRVSKNEALCQSETEVKFNCAQITTGNHLRRALARPSLFERLFACFAK